MRKNGACGLIQESDHETLFIIMCVLRYTRANPIENFSLFQ
jgi:hypothetical protein